VTHMSHKTAYVTQSLVALAPGPSPLMWAAPDVRTVMSITALCRPGIGKTFLQPDCPYEGRSRVESAMSALSTSRGKCGTP